MISLLTSLRRLMSVPSSLTHWRCWRPDLSTPRPRRSSPVSYSRMDVRVGSVLMMCGMGGAARASLVRRLTLTR